MKPKSYVKLSQIDLIGNSNREEVDEHGNVKIIKKKSNRSRRYMTKSTSNKTDGHKSINKGLLEGLTKRIE